MSLLRGTAAYGRLLRLPGARRVLFASSVCRLSYGTLVLSLVLVVEHATQSFAVAGAATAVFSASTLTGPAKAHLAGGGHPWRLRGLGGLAAAALLGLAALATTAVHGATPYLALSALAGLSTPPVGAIVRARWTGVVALDARSTALALDTALEDGFFLLGPLLAGGLVAVGGPPLAMAATAGLLATGIALVAAMPGATRPAVAGPPDPPPSDCFGVVDRVERAQLHKDVVATTRTDDEPAAGIAVPPATPTGRSHERSASPGRSASHGRSASREKSADWREGASHEQSASREKSADWGEGASWEEGAGRAGLLRPMRSGQLRGVLVVLLGAAAGTGVIDVAVTARAVQSGRAADAGAVLAATALGSVVGGLVWGARSGRGGAERRLAGLAGLVALTLAAAAAVRGLVLLAAILAIDGAALSPLLVVVYLATADLADPHDQTLASAWANATFNAGAAAGAAVGGVAVAAGGPGWAFLVGAAIAGAAALLALVLAGRRAAAPDEAG